MIITLYNSVNLLAQNVNGADVIEVRQSIGNFFSESDFIVDGHAKEVPSNVRHLIYKYYKDVYKQGKMSFKTSSTRSVQFVFKREDEYIIVYNHGLVGRHTHLVYANKGTHKVMFFYYNWPIESWRDIVNKLKLSDNKLKPSKEEA